MCHEWEKDVVFLAFFFYDDWELAFQKILLHAAYSMTQATDFFYTFSTTTSLI